VSFVELVKSGPAEGPPAQYLRPRPRGTSGLYFGSVHRGDLHTTLDGAFVRADKLTLFEEIGFAANDLLLTQVRLSQSNNLNSGYKRNSRQSHRYRFRDRRYCIAKSAADPTKAGRSCTRSRGMGD